jgi:hypothetical protein
MQWETEDHHLVISLIPAILTGIDADPIMQGKRVVIHGFEEKTLHTLVVLLPTKHGAGVILEEGVVRALRHPNNGEVLVPGALEMEDEEVFAVTDPAAIDKETDLEIAVAVVTIETVS